MGVIAAYVVSLVASAVVGAMVLRTTLAQGNLTSLMTWIGQASILLGAFYAARKARRAGIANGGLTGLCYVTLTFILGALIFPEPFNFALFGQKLVVGAIIGALGGTAGVSL